MAALLAERWLSERGLITEYHQPEVEAVEETKEAETKAADPDSFDPAATRHEGSYALRKLYHESDRPLVVKYVSPTCGPCHMLKPILDKVIDEFDGQIHFIEIDIEAESEIAENAGVIGTPTVQIFKDKALVDQMQGVKQKSQYRDAIAAQLSQTVNA